MYNMTCITFFTVKVSVSNFKVEKSVVFYVF